ncbi:HAD-IA family hydrolase [Altererythrobacter confluentis]|uniref:HAD-IA family hydrolase n=1 Tax=Allopontixanthobacter confluentis TaxID=1849021 RepID=A0A6L7GKX1_9SPHN|nr:HAD-IA family hydrolase [Allopontixanthobacter confluentis]MXP15528.1 HAD-IA family hydrolase [Allopontixanthobacter confluentis]
MTSATPSPQAGSAALLHNDVDDDELPADAVQAVVFDVGRVIVQWDLRCLFAKLIPDQQELDWFVANVVTEEWHFQHDAGRPLADMVPERKAQFPDYAVLIDAYAERFLETIPGPVAGTAALIDGLAEAGQPLFAITNFGAEFWEMFRPTEPVLDHFQDIVVSGKEKLAKPDPAIFQLAQARFGHAPAQMLFIDDNLANITAARREGWQVHHFENAAVLETDLRARGLIA